MFFAGLVDFACEVLDFCLQGVFLLTYSISFLVITAQLIYFFLIQFWWVVCLQKGVLSSRLSNFLAYSFCSMRIPFLYFPKMNSTPTQQQALCNFGDQLHHYTFVSRILKILIFLFNLQMSKPTSLYFRDLQKLRLGVMGKYSGCDTNYTNTAFHYYGIILYYFLSDLNESIENMPFLWLFKDVKYFLSKWVFFTLQEHKEKPHNFMTGLQRGINEFVYVSYFSFQKSTVRDNDLESGILLVK